MTWAPQVTVILGLGWAQLDATSHCFVFPILMQQGMMRINPMACSKFESYLMSSHNASYELSNPCGCHLAWPIFYRCLNCKCNENKPKKKKQRNKKEMALLLQVELHKSRCRWALQHHFIRLHISIYHLQPCTNHTGSHHSPAAADLSAAP